MLGHLGAGHLVVFTHVLCGDSGNRRLHPRPIAIVPKRCDGSAALYDLGQLIFSVIGKGGVHPSPGLAVHRSIGVVAVSAAARYLMMVCG